MTHAGCARSCPTDVVPFSRLRSCRSCSVRVGPGNSNPRSRSAWNGATWRSTWRWLSGGLYQGCGDSISRCSSPKFHGVDWNAWRRSETLCFSEFTWIYCICILCTLFFAWRWGNPPVRLSPLRWSVNGRSLARRLKDEVLPTVYNSRICQRTIRATGPWWDISARTMDDNGMLIFSGTPCIPWSKWGTFRTYSAVVLLIFTCSVTAAQQLQNTWQLIGWIFSEYIKQCLGGCVRHWNPEAIHARVLSCTVCIYIYI